MRCYQKSDYVEEKKVGDSDDRAVPKTKRDIVSLYLDRCALDHVGICSTHLPG